MPQRSLVRDGVIAGLIGGASVAIWFFVVDLIAGHPFYTPAVLGAAVLSVLGPGQDSMAFHVVFYTIVHFAAFALLGVVVNALLHAGEREPGVFIGLLILFVAFQLAFYGFTAFLAEGPTFGGLAWWQIGAANLVAAAMMWLYLRRSHPNAGKKLSFMLEGGDSASLKPRQTD